MWSDHLSDNLDGQRRQYYQYQPGHDFLNFLPSAQKGQKTSLDLESENFVVHLMHSKDQLPNHNHHQLETLYAALESSLLKRRGTNRPLLQQHFHRYQPGMSYHHLVCL